jgi:hypothetical protein
MTATSGFPAPGPQDRDQPGPGWYDAPPPTGPAAPMPQGPTLTAHRPGIVPLRPLQLGDILDGAVKSVRFNPKSMVGLSAVVLAVVLVPSAALGAGVTHLTAISLDRLGPEAEALLGIPAVLVQLLSTTLATAILSGLLMFVVGQAVLGRKPSLGQTWRSTRGRLGSLLMLSFLSLLFALVSFAVLIGPGVLLLFNDSIGAGVLLLFVGFFVLTALSVYVSTKISMAAPAIVLEGHKVMPGLRRSFALTRGSAFWRILGITLLAGVLAGIIGSLLGMPFTVIGWIIGAVSGPGSESGQMVVTFVSHLSALLTGAITTPFVAAVTGLLYVDRRMRLEALDVVLLRESQVNPAAPV